MLSVSVWQAEQRAILPRFVSFLFFPHAGQNSFFVFDVIIPISVWGNILNM